MGPHQLEKFFNPQSIAVVGASNSGRSVGSIVFSNLLAGEFEGDVFPVNPKYGELSGLTCYPSIEAIDRPVDLVVIATPAGTVARLIREAGQANVRHVIVISAGFGEIGEAGRAAEAELLDTARRAGVRFMGPNCVGLVRPWNKLNATFLKSSPPPGRLALVSQSGALCSAISDWAGPHNLGFSALVSLGNSADIEFGDVLRFLAVDPKTDAILLYVEGVKNANSFISALKAAARLKPIIVLKSGRHMKSAQAANTHTGALIGSDAVFDAALERAGAVRADTFGQLFAAAEILSTKKHVGGPRLGIITNGGGAGVLAADQAEALGLELSAPSGKTIEALDAFLPPFWSKGNPIDILGDATPETYGRTVEACIQDPNLDGVLVMLTPQAMTESTKAAKAIIEAANSNTKKQVLACWMGETSVAEARQLLSKSGIPNFYNPEQAVEAFAYLAKHERNQRLALEAPGPRSAMDTPDVEGARMIIEAALADGRDMLSDVESKAVLRAFHIPCGTTIEASSGAKALIAAETLGFPVAMKISSPQIAHKSDVGGVRINVANAGEVRTAFDEIVSSATRAKPNAEIRGVTVESMATVTDARELMIGVKKDPVFGPTILFGAGGTMVEILKDSAVSLPPLNQVIAERLIHRTRVSKLLDGFRDRPAVDREAVIDILLRISDLVCELPHIDELDINPLFAGPNGVVAVDARIRVSRPRASLTRYEHMAITPYPKHLEQEHFLADGTPMTIRPIRPEDAESEQAFVRALSKEAKRYRFMQHMDELSPKMLAQFTQIDYSREMALVAMVGEPGRKIQQGVARYVINPDDRSCEFAIVVGDEMQKKGIGMKLMQALIFAATDHKLKVMEGLVLADNTPMLNLVKELGFSIKAWPEDPQLCMVDRWL